MTTVSIIVPTRERAAALKYCLSTLVCQDYDGLEIVVSDNASNDGTRDVVEALNDPRLVYVQTDRRFDMSANWDFGLRHARGDYVCFLGDDDGFVAGGVATAMSLLRESGADCVGWDAGYYGWPNHALDEYKGRLGFCCRRPAYVRLGSDVWEGFRKGRLGYRSLFSLYQNGFVPKSMLVGRLGESGRFFRSTNPDIFGSIVATRACRAQAFAEFPLSVAGSSGWSNGSSNADNLRKASAEVSGATKQFFEEVKDTPWNRRLKVARSINLCIADAWLAADEDSAGFIPDGGKEVLSRCLTWAVQEAKGLPVAPQLELLEAVRGTAELNSMAIVIPDLVAAPVDSIGARVQFVEGIDWDELSCSIQSPSVLSNIKEACDWVGLLAPPGKLGRGSKWSKSVVFWLHRFRRVAARLFARVLRLG